jgi:glycolate oxidase FAD binding subunit
MAAPAPLEPANEAALVAMIREAAQAKRGLVTEGSGTKAHLGPAAPPDTQRVSLRALDRVLTYEPGDMVVCVEAGLKLADLQRTLARHNQWLPVDPPFADATLGGILATHSSGPRRLAYGTIKDLLLGARVIGAGGNATKSGGRVVKNVSGYDLHKLHVGAFGSLGVLVEANFRVSALPEAAAVLWLAAPTLPAAHQTLLDIASTSLRPCALEALDANSARTLAAAVTNLPKDTSLAIIGIETSRPVLERHLRDLAVFRAAASASGLIEGPGADRFWVAFRDVPLRHVTDITVRVGARRHDLSKLLGLLEPLDALQTGTRVQAALGIARISVTPPEDVSLLAASVSKWQRLATAHGGYAVIESAPVDCVGRARLPWAAPADHPLGAAIKRGWDPDQILNPGRMAC